jgi:hypothetical protein
LTTTTTRNTVEKMATSTRRNGEIFGGFLAEAREINVEFTRKTTESWMQAFRKQMELNQRMARKLYGEAEGQTGAVRGLMQDWTNAYVAPFSSFGFGPFGFLRDGMRAATRNAEQAVDMTRSATSAVADTAARMNGSFPVTGYDEMTVAEVAERLDTLTADELKQVREYEKRNKNRETLIDQIDRRIKATA